MACKCANKACLHNICHASTLGIILYCVGTAFYVCSYITPQWTTLTCRQSSGPQKDVQPYHDVLVGYSGIYEACFPKEDQLTRFDGIEDIQVLSQFNDCKIFEGMKIVCRGMIDSPVFLTSVKFLMAVALGSGVVLAGFLVKSRCARLKRPSSSTGCIYIAMIVPAVLGIIGDVIYRTRQMWGDIELASTVVTRHLSWSFIVNIIGCGIMLFAAIVLLILDRRLASYYDVGNEEEQRHMLTLEDVQQTASGSETKPLRSSLRREGSGSGSMKRTQASAKTPN